MCVAIVRVRYKNRSEPVQHLEFENEEELKNRVEQLKANDLVESLSLFSKKWTQEKVLTWQLRDAT